MRRGTLLALTTGLWAIIVASAPLPAQQAFNWTLPAGFPPPSVPADNPMSEAKVELGRHLFYDVRLSGNGTQSCGTCHKQARAFTDGRARSVGSTGQLHPRGSMSLVNVAYAQALTWANPTMTRLEDQVPVPMYGDHPIELGLDRTDRWLDALKGDKTYQRLFASAFGNQPDPMTTDNAVKAIATFERAIVSARSAYDRYHFDRDEKAISEAARRGEILFYSRPLSCFTCHGGIHFSNSMGSARRSTPVEMHNTGLYNLAGVRSYPPDDGGLYDLTHEAKDIGKFKAPTLRNIAVTAPYMHDGSVVTLEDALAHYEAGGRTIPSGPNQGVGRDNPKKAAAVRGFTLTTAERSDLVAFLQSLTDEALLQDPKVRGSLGEAPLTLDSAMWIESLEHVGDQAIGMCVQRLADDERERTAALLAWLTLDAIRSGDGDAKAWHECVNEILCQHVTLSVPDERLDQPESPWWNELLSRALQEFVRQNNLGPAINRHLQAFQGIGLAGQRES